MSRLLVLVRKELRSVRREKTIMFAIIVQLLIVSFSSVILIGAVSFYDPSSIGSNASVHLNIGVVGNADSPVIEFVERENNIDVWFFADISAAEDSFQAGAIDAIMSIPYGDSGVVDMQLVLPESDTRSTIILMMLESPFKKAENFMRQANGVQLDYADMRGGDYPTSYEFLYTIIIPLLMFFPALIAGSIVIDTVSDEMENNTLDTLWAAPVSLNQIFLSKIFAALVTVIAQCIVWIVLLRLNGFSVENFGPLLSVAIAVAGCVSFGAAIIGVSFKSRERSQFVYAIVLLIGAGMSSLLNPSPFNLITSLASGSQYANNYDVMLYLVPFAITIAIFLVMSHRLASRGE